MPSNKQHEIETKVFITVYEGTRAKTQVLRQRVVRVPIYSNKIVLVPYLFKMAGTLTPKTHTQHVTFTGQAHHAKHKRNSASRIIISI